MKTILDTYLSKFSQKTVTNPQILIRTMAEWEEIKAITLVGKAI